MEFKDAAAYVDEAMENMIPRARYTIFNACAGTYLHTKPLDL